MGLFQLGDFTLNSGKKSKWKLECDALTTSDWETLAEMIKQLVGPFSSVEGVPTGGLILAQMLQQYVTPKDTSIDETILGQQQHVKISAPHLIVDDVLTTGNSIVRVKNNFYTNSSNRYKLVIGAVVFARGYYPDWINAVFQMPGIFWI